MNVQKITLSINGMTCNGCAAGLQKALLRRPGVLNVEVSFADAAAQIEYDAELVNLAQLTETVDNAGFNVAAQA